MRYIQIIQIHPQLSLFCKNENLVHFHGLTISKFTYRYY